MFLYDQLNGLLRNIPRRGRREQTTIECYIQTTRNQFLQTFDDVLVMTEIEHLDTRFFLGEGQPFRNLVDTDDT